MRVNLFLEDSPHGFDFFKQLKCSKSDGILGDTWGSATRCEMRRVLVCYSRAWVILILSLELFLYVSDQGMDSLKGHE